MANQQILNQYNVVITRKKIWDEHRATIDTENNYLSMFIEDWDADDITNDLLPEIDKVLNGEEVEYQTAHNSNVTIYVKQNYTSFSYTSTSTPDYTIPTRDFRIVLEAWKEFLEQ